MFNVNDLINIWCKCGCSDAGADTNHYKFTGKERDAESGLDDFDARHYASSLGRFMQPDEFGGGPS